MEKMIPQIGYLIILLSCGLIAVYLLYYFYIFEKTRVRIGVKLPAQIYIILTLIMFILISVILLTSMFIVIGI